MTVTPATIWLDERGVNYESLTYDYRKSGAKVAAEVVDVDPEKMIKTLVMEDNNRKPFIILMHGDMEVSTKKMARELNVKYVKPCNQRNAERYTGYLVGGISPFSTKHELTIYMEESILDLPIIYINGGRRGFLLKMKPSMLNQALNPKPVQVSRTNE